MVAVLAAAATARLPTAPLGARRTRELTVARGATAATEAALLPMTVEEAPPMMIPPRGCWASRVLAMRRGHMGHRQGPAPSSSGYCTLTCGETGTR